MRVLDVGCGAGDVSFLAASLVGPDGFVFGVDKSPEAVAMARERAQQSQLTNVQFAVSDLEEVQVEEPVDALIGRLILMYFPRPAEVLRHLLTHVRPAGLVVFQELDGSGVTAEPACETFLTAGARIAETLRRAGADLRTGLKLPVIFEDAGLPTPRTLQMARVEHGPDAAGYAWMEQLTRTLLPLMERTGVASAAEVDVDTLAERIRNEVVARRASVVLPPFVGAWTRVGAQP